MSSKLLFAKRLYPSLSGSLRTTGRQALGLAPTDNHAPTTVESQPNPTPIPANPAEEDPARKEAKDSLIGALAVNLLLIIILMFLIGFAAFFDQTSWVSATTVEGIPYHTCTAGLKRAANPSLYVRCTASVPSNDTVKAKVSIDAKRASRIRTMKDVELSTVLWSELTANNTCNPASPLFESFAMRNNICSNGPVPTLNFPAGYFPVAFTSILFMSFLVLYVFVCFVLDFLCDDDNKPGWMFLILLLLQLPVLASGFAVSGVWFSYPLGNFIFPSSRRTSVVPMRNEILIYMGTATTNASPFYDGPLGDSVFELNETSISVGTPFVPIEIGDIKRSDGHNIVIASTVLLCFMCLIYKDVIVGVMQFINEPWRTTTTIPPTEAPNGDTNLVPQSARSELTTQPRLVALQESSLDNIPMAVVVSNENDAKV